MEQIFSKTITAWFLVLLFRALTLMLLWNWYIPYFFELKELPYLISFGICLIMDLLRSGDINFFKYQEKDLLVVAVKAKLWWLEFLGPLIILVIGFIGHFFV